MKTGTNTVGLYQYASRINHSCTPNAYHEWDEEISKKLIFANFDIKAGDELFIPYVKDEGCYIRQIRQAELIEKFFFECRCIACSLSPEEIKSVTHVGLISCV